MMMIMLEERSYELGASPAGVVVVVVAEKPGETIRARRTRGVRR
jgi:hypothetical protein